MSEPKLRLVLAQCNFLVGDIAGNTRRIIDAAAQARAQQADVIVFPELCLTGYPPEDLLLRPSLSTRIERALTELATVQGITLIIGFPESSSEGLFNAAVVLRDGQELGRYRKQALPNYLVFDEQRYFSPGQHACVVELNGVRVGLTICEDLWEPTPVARAKAAGAQLIVNLSASPFHRGKAHVREGILAERARAHDLPIAYVNLLGGQDELVFDGGSLAMQRDGQLAAQAPWFRSALLTLEFDGQRRCFAPQPLPAKPTDLEAIYQALVLAVRDYVEKNRFKGVLLGLSGGIDSALTLAIAVDALGAERVRAVMMPYHYTADISIADAREQADKQGVHFSCLSIAPMVEAFAATLADTFAGLPKDKTEENLQARSRGVLLMAISNKIGYLVLTTGNKSEMSVGYATLYGDMAGGFDVLKDVPKTVVFELASWRNQHSDSGTIIPQRVIDRPPSAELAPDQKDEDSLPPYPTLDEILRRYIELDESAEAIVQAGFDRDTVYRVLRMVDINEYKRRQAAIGPRITARGFGKDRRYPIVNGWPLGD